MFKMLFKLVQKCESTFNIKRYIFKSNKFVKYLKNTFTCTFYILIYAKKIKYIIL